jgi:hypothetical protein
MQYLGIDLHRKQMTVSLRNQNGDVFLRRQVSTRWPKLEEFRNQLHQALPHQLNVLTVMARRTQPHPKSRPRAPSAEYPASALSSPYHRAARKWHDRVGSNASGGRSPGPLELHLLHTEEHPCLPRRWA